MGPPRPRALHVLAQGGTKNERGQWENPLTSVNSGRVDWIRTSDPLTPSQVRYQTAPPPVMYRSFAAKEKIPFAQRGCKKNFLLMPRWLRLVWLPMTSVSTPPGQMTLARTWLGAYMRAVFLVSPTSALGGRVGRARACPHDGRRPRPWPPRPQSRARSSCPCPSSHRSRPRSCSRTSYLPPHGGRLLRPETSSLAERLRNLARGSWKGRPARQAVRMRAPCKPNSHILVTFVRA